MEEDLRGLGDIGVFTKSSWENAQEKLPNHLCQTTPRGFHGAFFVPLFLSQGLGELCLTF
jgi:sirohydrochlorin ferrochelatase